MVLTKAQRKIEGKKLTSQTHHLGQTRTQVLLAHLACTSAKHCVRNSVNIESFTIINQDMSINYAAYCFQTGVVREKLHFDSNHSKYHSQIKSRPITYSPAD